MDCVCHTWWFSINNLVLPVDAFRQISIATKFFGRVDVIIRTWQDQITPTSVKLFFESYKLQQSLQWEMLSLCLWFSSITSSLRSLVMLARHQTLPSLRVYLLNAHMIDLPEGTKLEMQVDASRLPHTVPCKLYGIQYSDSYPCHQG